jgi:hypothetical protein
MCPDAVTTVTVQSAVADRMLATMAIGMIKMMRNAVVTRFSDLC